MGLGLDKPDFILCRAGQPGLVIETKSEAGRSAAAIAEAIGYADAINATGRHDIRVAVGLSGEEDRGYIVEVRFFDGRAWGPLRSNGYELTNIPTKAEVKLALEANDFTTTVSVPSHAEFVDAGIEISRLLRTAKVEAPLRPKVIGAVVMAMSQGEIDDTPDEALASVNGLVKQAIEGATDLPGDAKAEFVDALRLSGADFNRLAPVIGRVVAILRRLNIASAIHTDADFLGMFYEAFVRYGYDNGPLGIVFTPRHITRFCVDLLDVRPNDRVIDIASGTGGFLVAAFDRMIRAARGDRAREKVKSSIAGFETNPTVWALALLNLFFRGNGKSAVHRRSSLEKAAREEVAQRFTKAFLNPPFSQRGEPERDFIDAAMDALEPGGKLAVVVKAGIFADKPHQRWRREFCRRHTVEAVISLPEDLFYPAAAAPTSILVARAHEPQGDDEPVLLARIWNDGFEKLKSRRVPRPGEQLSEIREAYRDLVAGKGPASPLALVASGAALKEGHEWSPQQWLPQPPATAAEQDQLERDVLNSILQATAGFPQLGDEVLADFGARWAGKPGLPLGRQGEIQEFFKVENGRSRGQKTYPEGPCPYVSSGDSLNSIVRTIARDDDQAYLDGALTVTAFGQAAVQPWPFMARGNGGSAVRVLTPRFAMTFRELLWFAAQINAQRWRFFYARMAIKSRLERLQVRSPGRRLPDGQAVAQRVQEFRDVFMRLSAVG